MAQQLWIFSGPARLSRGIGLPKVLPDIGGLALRIHAEETTDLLLASTGSSVLTRYQLLLRWRTTACTMTTMFPVSIDGRYIVFRARPLAVEGQWSLSYALWNGAWKPFAKLSLDETMPDDLSLRFDPTRNEIPGSIYPKTLRQLRDPSYIHVSDNGEKKT